MGYFLLVYTGYCNFMTLNHQLSFYLIKYLSNQNFRCSEFKDIYGGFIQEYPSFSAKKNYQRIYRVIRALVSSGLIDLKRTPYTYKYSSNYSTHELEEFLLQQEPLVDFKDKLKIESKEVNLNIEKTRLEINFFDMYMKEYPILKDTILQFKKKSEQQLTYLESQICVLNMIRTNV